jgi:hypothetical protein
MTPGDAGGRGGLSIVGHPESGLGERAYWPSGIAGGARDEGMMDRPAFPIRLLFQLIDQGDGEARNPAPRFGISWAFSWRGVGQSDRIDRSACDDDRRLPLRAAARHPSMHRTETLDYAVVLDREIYLVLTDSEILLKAGDTVVQWGTDHAWSNRTNRVARVAFALIVGRFAPRSAAAPLCAGRAAHTINGTRPRRKQMTSRTLNPLATAIAALALGSLAEGCIPTPAAAAAPTCVALATDPANGIAGNPVIKSASSVVVPATGPNVAYCKVSLLYGTNPNQNINIEVGLPLSAADGGSGGVQGAWNGRTEGLGGGVPEIWT